MYIAERGEREILEQLLKICNATNTLNGKNKNALFYAIDNLEKKEFADIVDLLSSSSDINIITQEGETPLLKAVERQFYKIVQILLMKGADVNLQNSKTCKKNPIFEKNHHFVFSGHSNSYLFENKK